jgi:hypothetical protein
MFVKYKFVHSELIYLGYKVITCKVKMEHEFVNISRVAYYWYKNCNIYVKFIFVNLRLNIRTASSITVNQNKFTVVGIWNFFFCLPRECIDN